MKGIDVSTKTAAPVLLITFNRPAYVAQMIDALRAANVSSLYVFKDGARAGNESDARASDEIKALIEGIDWECDVHTNYMPENLGCGFGPYTAISWAFEREEQLIILEDDCVPTRAFFRFCEQMLSRYRDEERVSVISGRCQWPAEDIPAHSDYIFTQYAPTWGWATWKRVWEGFSLQMDNLAPFFNAGGFSNQFATAKEADFFNRRYRRDRADASLSSHVWDNQFGYHSRIHGALRIMPVRNLINYIGVEGTHSDDSTQALADIPADTGFEARRHPQEIAIIKDFDRAYFNKYIYVERNILKRILHRIKKIMHI